MNQAKEMVMKKGYDLVAIAERLGFSKKDIRVFRNKEHRGLDFDELWEKRDAARFLYEMAKRVRQQSYPYSVVYRNSFHGAPMGRAIYESSRALLLCFAKDHSIRIVTL